MNSIIATTTPNVLDQLKHGLERLNVSWRHTWDISSKAIADLSVSAGEEVVIFVELPSSFEDSKRFLMELKKTTEATIVAIGSVTSTAELTDVFRAGADEFLDMKSGDVQNELWILLNRLFHSGDQPTAGTTIAVASYSGGCGASSVALNIAACLAQDYDRCGLVDMRMRGGDLAISLGMAPKYTIADLLTDGGETLEPEMVNRAILEHASGIGLLAAPEPFSNLSVARPHATKRILDTMKREYEHIVVELEDLAHADQVEVLRESDHVVLVFRPNIPSFVQTNKFVQFILAAGIPASRLALVNNRVRNHSAENTKRLERAFEPHLVVDIPDDSERMSLALTSGKPVVYSSAVSPSSRAFTRLTSLLIGETTRGEKTTTIGGLLAR